MSKNKGDIPAVISSANVERGESQKAHTYCANKKINSSEIIYLQSDIYQHLSPMGRMAADFLISENLLQVIDEREAAL